MRFLSNIAFTPSVIFLIAANMVPIFGAIFLGWDVATILTLYWLESVVIGVLNIPKILACRKTESGSFGSVLGNLFLTGFYMFHYGMFTAVHGAFLLQMFSAQPILAGLWNGGSIFWTALIFLTSHVFSMIFNFFGKKEYLGKNPGSQMFSVYGRVFIMHVVILFGGFAVQAFGNPIFALILLIVLKTVIDLVAHNKEHADK